MLSRVLFFCILGVASSLLLQKSIPIAVTDVIAGACRMKPVRTFAVVNMTTCPMSAPGCGGDTLRMRVRPLTGDSLQSVFIWQTENDFVEVQVAERRGQVLYGDGDVDQFHFDPTEDGWLNIELGFRSGSGVFFLTVADSRQVLSRTRYTEANNTSWMTCRFPNDAYLLSDVNGEPASGLVRQHAFVPEWQCIFSLTDIGERAWTRGYSGDFDASLRHEQGRGDYQLSISAESLLRCLVGNGTAVPLSLGKLVYVLLCEGELCTEGLFPIY